MGKGEPTLFERLETESEKSAQEELSDIEGLRHALWVRVLIAVGVVLVCAAMFPTGFGSRQSLDVGAEWQYETIVAEYPFPIYKPQQTYSREVNQAREAAPPVFTDNGNALKITAELESLALTTLGAAESLRENASSSNTLQDSANTGIASAEGRTERGIERGIERAPNAATLVAAAGSPLSAETINKLLALPANKREAKLRAVCGVLSAFQRTVYARGFINQPRQSLSSSNFSTQNFSAQNFSTQSSPSRSGAAGTAGAELLVRITPAVEQVYFAADVVDSAAYQMLWERLQQDDLDDLGDAIARDVQSRLFQPNLIYSRDLSDAAVRLAEQSVTRTVGVVRKGEVVVSRGERLTDWTIQKIRSSDYTRFLYSKSTYSLAAVVGNVLYAAFIYGLLLAYLFIMRKRIYYDNAQLLGVSLPLVVIAFAAWQTTVIPATLPLQYLIAVPVMSMLIAITFDSRTTFTATVAMALLLAGVRGNDYNTALGALLAGTFAGYTVRDMRNRTQIFASILFIFLGYALPILAIAIKTASSLTDVLWHLLFAGISAVISPIITLGLLYVLERALNITTDLRLLEYDDLTHPLLEELQEKAPGTYQHTLNVARLAEQAAIEIGANPILAKVGAYFHDIGKMRKAEYFVENQRNVANKHDRLSPVKSASIIRQHVSEGEELAAEYKLPRRIADFIPMHHGTMLIKYFYGKALEKALEKAVEKTVEKAVEKTDGKTTEQTTTPETSADTRPDKSALTLDYAKTLVDEEDFRYPGPKPNTKETGILMLADAVEATSHTIDTNDRDELERVVNKLVEERILDGELDECDLTMRDLSLIRESFVRNLLGTGHQRVKYKDIPRNTDDDKHDDSGNQPQTA
jgi:cyclic-di-AMP phosphodiesterase PgpH